MGLRWMIDLVEDVQLLKWVNIDWVEDHDGLNFSYNKDQCFVY